MKEAAGLIFLSVNTAFLLCLYLSFEELIYNDTVQAEQSQMHRKIHA